MNCEFCEYQNTKKCDECMDQHTTITIAEVRKLLKEAEFSKSYTQRVNRSWEIVDPMKKK